MTARDGGLFIANATVVDGTGAPGFAGDVLVRGGRIAEVRRRGKDGSGGFPDGCGGIDAAGRVLAPGFIDIHRHADLRALEPGFGEAELLQGITTCVCGNCGMSAAPCSPGREAALLGFLESCLGRPPEPSAAPEAPATSDAAGGIGGFATFAAYAEALSAAPLRLNVGAFVGNGTVRIAVKGFDPGPLCAEELARAKAHIAEAMEAGAMGLSMGLLYAPECYYTAEALSTLAEQAARAGGLLSTHIRGEGGSLETSVAEVLGVAERAGAALHISHFKAASRSVWGAGLERAIALVEGARSRGQDVTCDVYPYAAGSTMLVTLLPPALLEGGMRRTLERIRLPEGRRRLREALSRSSEGWDNLVLSLGWGSVVVSSVYGEGNGRFAGRSIADIARSEAMDEVDCLCELLLGDGGRTGMVLHCMSPDDVRRVLTLPWSMVISDAIYPAEGLPHPRLYGAFPRVIREYVLERRTLTLEQAVRKMTSMPAARMGLAGRGLILPGYIADLILFDPARVSDRATYERPAEPASGMDLVLVGGRTAVRDGALTGIRNGKFIRKGVLD